MKLQAKLSSLLIPLIVLPLFIIGGIGYVQLEKLSKQQSNKDITTSLAQIRATVETSIRTANSNIALFSNSMGIKEYLLTEDEEARYLLLQPNLHKLFVGYQKAYPNYYEIRVLLPDGYEDTRVTVSPTKNHTEQETNSDLFKRLQSDGSTVSVIGKNPDNDQIALMVGKAIYTREQNVDPLHAKQVVIGYLAATVSLDFLQSFTETTTIGKTGSVLFTDRTGTILFAKDKASIGTRLDQTLFSHLQKTAENTQSVEAELNNIPTLFQVTQPHENLYLIGSYPKSDLTEESKQLALFVTVTILVAILLIGGMLTLVMQSLLVAPIRKLSNVSHAIGDGNLDIQFNQSSNDELGELAQTIALMAGKLKQSQRLLEKKNRELFASTQLANQASEAKTAFVANMSHEIRTPLTAIIGFSEYILDDGVPSHEREEALHTIIRSGKHLQQIINDILDLAKIEANKLEVENVEVALFELLDEVRSLIQLHAQSKGLSFDIYYTFPLPAHFTSDPVRIKQVLINLCSNAIKFTASGEVGIHVCFDQTEQQLLFNVVDTGIGLSEEQTQRIFGAFSQADNSTTRQFGGTGLGLHISREIAHNLGGDINVHSKLGEGSSFCFSCSLPQDVIGHLVFALPTAIDDMPTSPMLAASAKPTMDHAKVLLAEDNLDNQLLISLHLKALNIDPVIVGDGEAAVAKALQEPFDLILMDVQMPLMNGLDATRALRAQHCSYPIVALTANSMQADVTESLEAGCNEFLSKPLDKERFHEVVSHYIELNTEQTKVEPIYSSLLEADDEANEIVAYYLTRLPSIFDQFQQAYDGYDWQTLAALCHDLKSTAGGYGFGALMECAREMEQTVKAQNMPETDMVFANLTAIYQRILSGVGKETTE